MSDLQPRPRRRAAWVVGVVVLAALAGAVGYALQSQGRLAARLLPKSPVVEAPAAPVPPPLPAVALPQPLVPATEATVRGVVRAPDGRPAAGASVSVYRAMTVWPEWRRERLEQEQAFTGSDGVFQFRLAEPRGLLLRVQHPQFAEQLVEAPLGGGVTDVRLEPGFELFGVVTNDAGAPIDNARVAIESVPGDNRRAEVRTTSRSGAYRFTNVPAGPVRLVARHEAWQPTALPAIVVGDQRRVDLRFTRPAMSPLRGKVLLAGSREPVRGAVVELLPLNGKLGLVDTHAAATDAAGEFTVAGLARGSMRLFVRHPEHGAVVTTQTVGVVATPLEIELPRRSLVTGQLAVDAGAPLWRGGEVLQLRDAAGQLAFADVAADGSFRFAAPLSPGFAELRTTSTAFAFQRSFTTEVDVRIEEAMATTLELVVVAPAILRGRLVDETGKPLAGASLTRTKLLVEGTRNITDAAAQLDLSMIGRQVAQLFTSDRDERLATSDQAGVFTIRGAKPGPLIVRAALAGFGSRLVREAVGVPGTSRDLGDIVLPRAGRLQGHVLRGGRPFAGATVMVVRVGEGTQPQATTVTDALGTWAVDDLMPGDWRVRARLPSQPAGSSVRIERVRAEGPPTHVTVVLDVGRTVRGEVLDTDGQAVAGALVSVRGRAGASTSTDASGDFALELPDRASELQVSLADRSRSTIVAVPRGDERLTVRLDTPPTCTIVASLAGLPGRKLLGSAVLRLAKDAAETEGEVRSHWVETPDGELRWSLCPAGLVRIEVWCDGYAPVVLERTLEANKEHALGELLLEPGCRLTGVVRRPDGAPIANAQVMLGEESDLELFEAGTRTAADGSFRLTGVSGRSRRLVVRAVGFAARVVALELPRDVLAPGPLVVTLEQGAAIEVVVDRSVAREGGFVQLRRDGRFLANAEMTEAGAATFANRSAGTYTVQVVGDPRPAKVVVVEPGVPRVPVRLP